MPLYEFRCLRCDARFEELVSASERVACPRCDSAEVDKLMASFAVGSSRPAVPEACEACPGVGRGCHRAS